MQGFWSECEKFKANLPGGQHAKNASLNLSHRAVTSSSDSPGYRQAPASVNNEQPRSLPRDAAHQRGVEGWGATARAAALKLGGGGEGFRAKLGWPCLRSSSEHWNHKHSDPRRAWAVATEGEGGGASAGVSWGYFLQIMILLLFAGSGTGRRAEDLYPTGCSARDKKPPGHP